MIPKTAKQAARDVIQKIRKQRPKVTIREYCLDRGVSPAILSNWKSRNKRYDGFIYQKLMEIR